MALKTKHRKTINYITLHCIIDAMYEMYIPNIYVYVHDENLLNIILSNHLINL